MRQDTMPQVAKYWNTIAQDFDTIYSGQKSPLARKLDQILRKDMYQRFDWVMECAGDIRGKSVCDIGCGSGRFVDELARRGSDRLLGIDVAPEMLKMARRLVQQNGHASVCEFVEADIIDWKPEEKFDMVIAIGFWDYIADPTKRLEIIRKMTRGKFLSAWPRFWTWRMPVRKVRLGALGCPVYFYRKSQVIELLKAAHFEPVSIEVKGKLFCVEARPV